MKINKTKQHKIAFAKTKLKKKYSSKTREREREKEEPTRKHTHGAMRMGENCRNKKITRVLQMKHIFAKSMNNQMGRKERAGKNNNKMALTIKIQRL